MVVFTYGLALSASQVQTRFTWDQQRTVAAWLDTHTAPDAAARVVAVPFFLDYFRLYQPLTSAGFRVQPREPGKWFEGPPPILVVPDWYATAIRRDQRDPKLLADLDALESGTAGFRPVFHLSTPPYLQQGLDVRLDPAFAVDLWQGTIGFTVYARNGAVQP
jgi:hypothetical protein